MFVVAKYSFNKGKEFIEKHHKKELEEVYKVISLVDASKCKTKISKEKTMNGKLLYSPIDMNKEFKKHFFSFGWIEHKIGVKVPIKETGKVHKAFRSMDATKNDLGIEVQFGKYAFMVYDILAKMVIFSNFKIIDSGIEIVPMRTLEKQMSTGVSSFEQVKTDFRPEFSRLEELKEQIANDQEMLNDIALSEIMNGRKVELTDDHQTQYEPVLQVNFKKVS